MNCIILFSAFADEVQINVLGTNQDILKLVQISFGQDTVILRTIYFN